MPFAAGRPLTPWTEYILKEVANRPLPLSQLIIGASSKVPPGRAYRRGLSMYNAVRRHRGESVLESAEGRRQEEIIRRGRRWLAQSAIRQLAANGRLAIGPKPEQIVIIGPRPKDVMSRMLVSDDEHSY